MDMKKFGFMLLTACLGGVITLGAYKLVETKITDINSWDSLNHINLIVALEEEFNISFSDSDIVAIKGYSDIENILKKHKVLE